MAVEAAQALKLIDNPNALLWLVAKIRPPRKYGVTSSSGGGPTVSVNNGRITRPVQLQGGTAVGLDLDTDQAPVRALRQITGEDFGTDKAAWMAWIHKKYGKQK